MPHRMPVGLPEGWEFQAHGLSAKISDGSVAASTVDQAIPDKLNHDERLQ